MQVITKKYEVFSFDELSEEAQNKAIRDEIQFFVECISYDDMLENMKQAVAEAEDMRMPWFTGSYIYDYCREEIIEIHFTKKIRDYLENYINSDNFDDDIKEQESRGNDFIAACQEAIYNKFVERFIPF